MPESLELFSDVLLNPTFPEPDFARLKQQTLAGIQQEKAQPRGIAMRLFPKLVYGAGHAYGNPLSGSGSEESVGALRIPDLRAFYERWVRPDNSTLLIVGDTTLAQVLPMLEQRFASWRAPSAALPKKELALAARPGGSRVFLVNRTGAEQSTILAGYAGPSRSDAGYTALQTLNAILGDNFVSRLNMNLREDKHWSYGVRSALVAAAGPGPFLVSAPVQTDKTAESMQEILKELRDVIGPRPPLDAEIDFARKSLVLALPGNNETADEVAGSYTEILTYNLPDGYWNDYVSEVNAITAPQLAAAAGRLVRPAELTWLVIGDLQKMEESVRQLGLGQVTVLDADGKVLR